MRPLLPVYIKVDCRLPYFIVLPEVIPAVKISCLEFQAPLISLAFAVVKNCCHCLRLCADGINHREGAHVLADDVLEGKEM